MYIVKIKSRMLFIFLMVALSAILFLNIKQAHSADYYGGGYLFDYYNCVDCHSINGAGGTLGPSLSHYALKHKSYTWTAAQIAYPSLHFKLGTRVIINGKQYYVLMPSYNYVPSSDIGKIARYLESLK